MLAPRNVPDCPGRWCWPRVQSLESRTRPTPLAGLALRLNHARRRRSARSSSSSSSMWRHTCTHTHTHTLSHYLATSELTFVGYGLFCIMLHQRMKQGRAHCMALMGSTRDTGMVQHRQRQKEQDEGEDEKEEEQQQQQQWNTSDASAVNDD